MNNAEFWARHVEDVFVPHLGAFREAVFKRVLPAFDNLSEEAQEMANEARRKLLTSASLETDPADLAEAAHEQGLYHYQVMSDVEQTLVNLIPVAIHHIVEQQQLFILRRELLLPDEERNGRLLKRDEFVKRLRSVGIDPAAFPSWACLEELRSVANAVKHADGSSVDELRTLRPDLWSPPAVRDHSTTWDLSKTAVYQPLGGQDLYITKSDLEKYFDHAERFWRDFTEALQTLRLR